MRRKRKKQPVEELMEKQISTYKELVSALKRQSENKDETIHKLQHVNALQGEVIEKQQKILEDFKQSYLYWKR